MHFQLEKLKKQKRRKKSSSRLEHHIAQFLCAHGPGNAAEQIL